MGGTAKASGASGGAPQTNGTATREGAGPASSANGTVLLRDDGGRWVNLARRSVWSVVLLGAFAAILLAGHLYLMVLVVAIQATAFYEIMRVSQEPGKDRKLPYMWYLNWYFFYTAHFFLYGDVLIHYFSWPVSILSFGVDALHSHAFICYSLYMAGIVAFVLSLKKGQYRFQFGQLAWTHTAIFFVVVQPNFILNNILEGIVWFLLPVSLVIVNDIMAYVFGFLFGRTPLIALSPKKTLEGFLGGGVSTVLFSFVFAGIVGRYSYLICPADRSFVEWHPFASLGVTCPLRPEFVPFTYVFRPGFTALLARLGLHVTSVSMIPLQLHAVALSVFASIIAPFGGFFASGFKRAFKIKDFGDSIPGHGGITDRFDCQFLMGAFAYLYYTTFIRAVATWTVGNIMDAAVTLSIPDQVELLSRLQNHIASITAVQ